MKSIEKRVLEEAIYMCTHLATIREVSKIFNVSKSTVHNDLSIRLKSLNYMLYDKVNKILQYNKKIKHIRGGESTRRKYKKLS